MKAHVALGCLVFAISCICAGDQAQAVSADEWCQNYARIAVNQYNESRGFNRCRRSADARWHSNSNVHFDWCMKVSEQAARSEDAARRSYLQSCKQTRHD